MFSRPEEFLASGNSTSRSSKSTVGSADERAKAKSQKFQKRENGRVAIIRREEGGKYLETRMEHGTRRRRRMIGTEKRRKERGKEETEKRERGIGPSRPDFRCLERREEKRRGKKVISKRGKVDKQSFRISETGMK